MSIPHIIKFIFVELKGKKAIKKNFFFLVWSTASLKTRIQWGCEEADVEREWEREIIYFYNLINQLNSQSCVSMCCSCKMCILIFLKSKIEQHEEEERGIALNLRKKKTKIDVYINL